MIQLQIFHLWIVLCCISSVRLLLWRPKVFSGLLCAGMKFFKTDLLCISRLKNHQSAFWTQVWLLRVHPTWNSTGSLLADAELFVKHEDIHNKWDFNSNYIKNWVVSPASAEGDWDKSVEVIMGWRSFAWYNCFQKDAPQHGDILLYHLWCISCKYAAQSSVFFS